MKYIRILNLLKKISFGMSIFLFAVSLLSALANNFEVKGTVGNLIIAFIFLIPGLVISKVVKGIRIRRLAEQREKFYSILEDPDQGIFPANVILKGNETCFLNDYVVMNEIVRESIRTYTGTRLNLGRIPVYFGGGKSVSNETYGNFTFGELLLTNFRLIFIGDKRNIDLPLDKIIGVECFQGGIRISQSGKNKPILFNAVPNPQLWKEAILVLSDKK